MILEIEIMGRTVPSNKMASDREKRKWKVFREQFDKNERKTFNEMMSISRLYTTVYILMTK